MWLLVSLLPMNSGDDGDDGEGTNGGDNSDDDYWCGNDGDNEVMMMMLTMMRISTN